MEISIITSSVALIKDITTELTRFYKFTEAEVSSFFESGIKKYLESHLQKYLFTKTFLFRDRPIYFFDIYFPLQLSARKLFGGIQDDIGALIINNKYLSITGGAGCGKTMLMRFFFLNAYSNFLRIPIFIEFRNFSFINEGFQDYIFKIILENKISPNDKIMERLLQEGKFIFLLDGYDELDYRKKSIITSEINSFIDRYHNNNFIISSRPEANVESIPRFITYNIEPLSNDSIISFIDVQRKNFHDATLLDKIKTNIEEIKSSEIVVFLKNPLLLSMFILTYEYYPELPKTKSRFYFNVSDTLFTRHDAIKGGGFQHEKKSGLQREEIEEVLKWLSLLAFIENKFSFELQDLTSILLKIQKLKNLSFKVDDLIYDLVVSINIILLDGAIYSFPHRSQQEYYVALLLSQESVEFKESFYKHNLNTLSGSDLSNFWLLCIELDKESFYSMYVIEEMHQFLKIISYGGDVMYVAMQLMKYLDIGFSYIENIENGEMVFESMTTTGNVFKELASFVVGINLNVILYRFAPSAANPIVRSLINKADSDTRIKSEPKINDHEERIVKRIYMSYLEEGDFRNYLAQSRLPQKIGSFCDKLNSKILEIEKEIADLKAKKIGLLNI
ncbi:NACHT domain-containing protein [Chitinophaga nivalis]|uniref:NACHT domain-containing protein n=1 Tax=Chitinophaga nivalis TaxID=2991709 RepID=A0ABT3II29_9BACT|nr:NACHT domain-containing protein [Chitinophaga nivalis]MCW3466692.1 NACHT domain-containing protein [Chitinophaga nivalis]MCW3483617.1 NACHT domain-containing protein [Chitinophaga nivalis]